MKDNDLVHEETYKGYTIKIFNDDNPTDPRWDDNLGIMVCFHKRYSLGDKHNIDSGEFNGWDEMEDYIRKNKNAILILPLYMYGHSGLSIKTTPFGDPWDSGKLGFIYTTEKKIKEQLGVKEVTQETIDKAEKILEAEVELYSQYVNGECYGYQIEGGPRPEGLTSRVYEDGIADSCWGFFGYYDAEYGALSEAKGCVDYRVGRIKNKDAYSQAQHEGMAIAD